VKYIVFMLLITYTYVLKLRRGSVNVRDLEYFLAVYDTQHFSKAAERCFVSQPALSMQIKKLEANLGVTLFERNGKQFIYTDVSHEIATHAKTILQHINSIKAVAKMHQDPFSGDFAIGAFPTISPYFFSRIVPKLSKSYQNLTLLLTEEKSEAIEEKLLEGQLDVAVLALPQTHPALEHAVILEDQFTLAVAKHHPWANRKNVSFEEIHKENVILLEEGHCLRDQCLDICLTHPSFKSHPFKATSMQTLKHMVAANVGITLIPQSMQQREDKVSYIPFKKANFTRQVALTWRKQSAKIQLIDVLLKLCKQLISA
jgi:LysR family transcriptional regulator, hydrogen peroxide-inducible genes activator